MQSLLKNGCAMFAEPWTGRTEHSLGSTKKLLPILTKQMKIRWLPVAVLVCVAINFAVPASIAQDTMKVIRADELVWKEHPVFKGAQTVILVGDPTKAETIVQRVKLPAHYKVPPHTHPYSEVVTVLSGTYWNAMGDDEKGVALKPGSVFVLPANHVHHTWTEDEEVVVQINFTGPGGATFVNPDDDPGKKAQQPNQPTASTETK
jgi:quercetin dioxygenase-like cupin family protein